MRLTPGILLRAFAIVLPMLALPAHAVDDADPRWQFTVAADASVFDGDQGNVWGVPVDLSGDAVGWRIEGAFRVWGPLWFEAGYLDMGSYQAQSASCDFTGFPAVPPTCVPTQIEISTRAYSVSVRAEMALGGAWHGFLRYGLFEYTNELPLAEYDESGPVVGLGLVYGFDDRYAVTLAWETYQSLERYSTRPDSTASLGLRITL